MTLPITYPSPCRGGNGAHPLGVRLAILPMALFALCAVVERARACDDPVYLHTLTHWERQEHRVLRFHSAGAPVSAAMRVLDGVLAEGRANMVLHATDVTKISEIPAGALARQVWERHKKQALPFFVVVAPNGREVFAGSMSARDASQLVDSPQRMRLAELLAGSKEGVLVLLTGAEQDATNRARDAAQAAVERANGAGHDVGWMVVDRNDAREVWLVRQLLTMSPSTRHAQEPMLFGTLGKGHVLRPYVGAGITAEAVDVLIGLYNAPCTCNLLYDLMGMDLLTDFDWASVSADEPEEDERPYYSLLSVAEAEREEGADARAPAASVSTGWGLARQAVVALACLAAVAIASGVVVLKLRRPA